jgi:hypothetical protein
MATITINYTANYAGDHRICYRQVGTTDYCCLTDTVAAAGPQTFIIDFATPADYCDGLPEEVVVPVETDCGPYDYEGYIQPVCEDISSLNNRTAWTANFTLNPNCLAYIITCNSAGIDQIIVTDGGSYTGDSVVNITGGGGSGATAEGHFGIYNLFGDAAGLGYTAGDVLSIVGGTGTATEVTVNTIGGAGEVTSFTITNPGDYTVTPGSGGLTVTGGTGAGATFDPAYEVIYVTVTAPGDDYTSAPTISIPTGAAVLATAHAVMLPCADFTTPSCGATATVGISIGNSAVFCDTTGTPVLADDGYSVAADPAVTCCGCSLITAVAYGTRETIPYIYYTDADTHDVVYLDNGGGGYLTTIPGTQILLGPLGNLTSANAVPNSWGAAPGYEANFVVIAVDCA